VRTVLLAGPPVQLQDNIQMFACQVELPLARWF
jgi:hypothetical protein